MIPVSSLFLKTDGESTNVLKQKREISMWEKFGVIENIEEKGQESRILTKWIPTEKKDDYFMVGEEKFVEFMKIKIEDEFTVGKTVRDSFKYLGMKTEERKDSGFQQNQEEYISSLEKVEIPAGHLKWYKSSIVQDQGKELMYCQRVGPIQLNQEGYVKWITGRSAG